ncbi:hypothetical protein O0L34_g8610 [Tuta absoluta]|nr:hypothetical protein O0L34_g8610 [Tuta absoluta]
MIKKQRNSQMFHLKQALRVEPRYLHGTARRLLTAWACMLKQVNALQGFGESSSSSTVTYHSLTYSASERASDTIPGEHDKETAQFSNVPLEASAESGTPLPARDCPASTDRVGVHVEASQCVAGLW